MSRATEPKAMAGIASRAFVAGPFIGRAFTRGSGGCGSSSCGATRARSEKRYRLPLRSGWWADQVQVESLAALAAWVEHYDSGEWDDPPGKLALLYDLDRVAHMLRDGTEPFHPDRDRLAFARYLIELGCQPPPSDSKPSKTRR